MGRWERRVPLLGGNFSNFGLVAGAVSGLLDSTRNGDSN